MVVEPILLEADHDERALPLVLIDTSVGNVVQTQDRIKQADMVVVMAGVGNESDLRDVNNYWIQDQLRSVRAEQPILLILNKVDEVTKEELEQITQKWIKLFQHQLWELHLFVSARTGEGVENMIEQFSNTLISCAEWPRSVLIDRYNDKLKPNFVAALKRVFRCLDAKGYGVLGLKELRYMDEKILSSELTAQGFTTILQELNKINVDYVKLQGITLQGFLYMIQRMTRLNLWMKCWLTLQYYDYNYDLTLNPQPQWTLDISILQPGQVIELLPQAFDFLEELFDQYAVQRSSYISQDEIRTMFSVLPDEGICPLLQPEVFSVFERDMTSRTPALTRNGWLSYWALVAAEKPERTLKHMSYLVNTRSTDTQNGWFRICRPKSEDKIEDTCDRMLIRALIVAAESAGKSTFARQLISGQKSTSRRETSCQMFCNKVYCEDADQYRFLCLTEVQTNRVSFEYALKNLLPVYDLVLLAYDSSAPKSFNVMLNLFSYIRQHNVSDLPIQVLALKANAVRGMTLQDKKQITMKLEELGLSRQEEVWLSPGDSQNNDFDKLFAGLVNLGKTPGYGRVRPKPPIRKLTYLKRACTISLVLGTIYGIYRYFTMSSEKKGVLSVPKELKPALVAQSVINQQPRKYPVLGALKRSMSKS